MTVELTPITDADVAAVADFLHANYNDRIPWALSCSAVPWAKTIPPTYTTHCQAHTTSWL